MDNKMDELVGRMIPEIKGWKSVKVRLKTHGAPERNSALSDQEGFVSERSYVETSTGQRASDERIVFRSGKESHLEGYCDGAKCAKVVHDLRVDAKVPLNRIEITRTFLNEDRIGSTQRPRPLVYYFVGKTPLYEAVASATSLGETRALGRDCMVLLFQKVKWVMVQQDLVYTIDKVTGLPLRVDSFRDEQSRLSEQPLWTWKADSLDQVGAYHLVKNSTFLEYMFDSKTQKSVLTSTSKETVTDVWFDQDYADSSFWPKSAEGFSVIDTVTGNNTLLPQHRAQSDVLIPSNGTKVGTKVIESRQPASWSSYLGAASLLLGIGILAVGVVIAKRRRSGSN